MHTLFSKNHCYDIVSGSSLKGAGQRLLRVQHARGQTLAHHTNIYFNTNTEAKIRVYRRHYTYIQCVTASRPSSVKERLTRSGSSTVSGQRPSEALHGGEAGGGRRAVEDSQTSAGRPEQETCRSRGPSGVSAQLCPSDKCWRPEH